MTDQSSDPAKFDGQLPEVALKDFIAEFKEKTKDKAKCELCGSNDWGLEPKFVSPTILNYKKDEKLQIESGVAFPSVLLSCHNCGNMKMLRAWQYKSLRRFMGERDD